MKEITTRQMAMIKRIAMNVNPLVVKKNKLVSKINELTAEIAEINSAIEGNEMGIKSITGGLSSEVLITKTVTDSGKVDKNGNPIKVTKYEPNTECVQWNEDKKVYTIIEDKEPAVEEPTVEEDSAYISGEDVDSTDNATDNIL